LADRVLIFKAAARPRPRLRQGTRDLIFGTGRAVWTLIPMRFGD
jgi:hypothetical protein